MNSTEKDLLAQLESMPLEEARTAIRNRTLGNDFDSPNHAFCLSWLAGKEESARSMRERKLITIASRANFLACSAFIISAIAAHKEIIWVISKILSLIPH